MQLLLPMLPICPAQNVGAGHGPDRTPDGAPPHAMAHATPNAPDDVRSCGGRVGRSRARGTPPVRAVRAAMPCRGPQRRRRGQPRSRRLNRAQRRDRPRRGPGALCAARSSRHCATRLPRPFSGGFQSLLSLKMPSGGGRQGSGTGARQRKMRSASHAHLHLFLLAPSISLGTP